MRHGRKINHLGRTDSHRKAMLANMACSLIEHKRIATTLAKARALRKYVEPLLTKAKTDTTHSRRVVFSYLQSKEAIKALFDEIAVRIAERNGGYTRILKLGPRQGDSAELALIELVDYNEIYKKEESAKKTRRSRRKAGSSSVAAPANPAPVANAPEAVVEPVAKTDEAETSAESEKE